LKIFFDTDILRQIEIFLEWSETNSNSPRTHEIRISLMQKFREFIEEKRSKKIVPSLYEDFKKHLKKASLAPRSVDIHLTSIGRMITVLEEMEIIPKGFYPLPKLIRPKKVTAPKFWTEEEVEIILESASKTYIYNILRFALNTGLRLNELRYLRWGDVNSKNIFFLVQSHPEDGFNPKDYELRRIKLNREALDVIIEQRNNVPSDIPYVFPNKYGRPRVNCIKRDLRIILKRVGITDKGGWHCARRTFACHLLMAGADIESVRIILGHSDLETTKRYLSVTDKHLHEVVDLVGFTDKIERGKVLSFKKG
jgi:integrase